MRKDINKQLATEQKSLAKENPIEHQDSSASQLNNNFKTARKEKESESPQGFNNTASFKKDFNSQNEEKINQFTESYLKNKNKIDFKRLKKRNKFSRKMTIKKYWKKN